MPTSASTDVHKSVSMVVCRTTEEDSGFSDLRRVSTLATVGVLEKSRHVCRHEDAVRIGAIRTLSRVAMSKG